MNSLELVEILKKIIEIKSQTDKLQFDANNNLKLDIANDEVGIAKNMPTYPLVIDFSKEWHKEFVNADELGAEIVDLTTEGIPLPYDGHSGKALKITLNAGETKYLRIPLATHYRQVCLMLVYLTGDAIIEAEEVTWWTGFKPKVNVTGNWYKITSSVSGWDLKYCIFKVTATNGGIVYISQILLLDLSHEKYVQYAISSHERVDLSASTATYYVNYITEESEGIIYLGAVIGSDGTNTINIDFYLRHPSGDILILSASTTNSEYAYITIPVKAYATLGQLPIRAIKVVVSGTGYISSLAGMFIKAKISYTINGLKTASASNVSTTVTRYTLIDNNGRGNRYKQASVVINVPSTGGSATLYINGQQVGSWGAGASVTFNIPDDIDIWKIEVDLAGDGTNPATADFSGLELSGPYIVRR